jgi:signal peptidase I
MIWSLRIAIAVIAVAILSSAGWRLAGGSEYIITSPSMCPDLCVGSLVLDVAPGQHFHAGEIVSFTPPDINQVYTHRIVYVFANGSFETKGDAANIIDPWRVYPSMVRGREVVGVPVLGWCNLALPFLAMALTLILIARRMFPSLHRREWDRLFVSLMIVVPIWLLKPLVRGIIVQTTTLGPKLSQMIVVNTGLLPAQFKVPGGRVAAFIDPGHRAVLTGVPNASGELPLSQTASFHWWGWALVMVAVSSPLIWYVINLLRPSSKAEREWVLRGRYVPVPTPLTMPDMDLVLSATASSAPPRDRSRPLRIE